MAICSYLLCYFFVVANHVKEIYWQLNNDTSVTFHCVLSNVCNTVIGGCVISLIRQDDGKSVNITIPVIGDSKTVEGSFDKLNLSESYLFTATAVSQDLVIPIGKPVSGIIPAVTLNNISHDAESSMLTTVSTVSEITVTSTQTSTASYPFGLRLPSTITVSPTESSAALSG